ncbi:hypothetical protein FHR71_005522 [Methylobacterium sp. RAS18]|nr:hypothetical protein [Methylobacterium sp. RAS18]
MALPSIIKVDASGKDAGGNDYQDRVAPHIIAAGLMLERPVLLQYPDGRLEQAVEVRVTPKGLEHIRHQLQADEAGHKPGNA